MLTRPIVSTIARRSVFTLRSIYARFENDGIIADSIEAAACAHERAKRLCLRVDVPEDTRAPKSSAYTSDGADASLEPRACHTASGLKAQSAALLPPVTPRRLGASTFGAHLLHMTIRSRRMPMAPHSLRQCSRGRRSAQRCSSPHGRRAWRRAPALGWSSGPPSDLPLVPCRHHHLPCFEFERKHKPTPT